MDRRFGDWRVLADEYEHENWLDENDTDVLDAVLDAVLVRDARSARSCSPWLTSGRKNRGRRRYHRSAAFSGRSGPPLA
jgi:hypothetical protein